MDQMRRHSIDPAIAARRARKKDVERILDDGTLCTQLRTYFREQKPYADIVDTLGGPTALGVKESLSIAEVHRILGLVKHELVDVFTGDAHTRKSHAVTAEKCAEAIGEGRREWMTQQGFFVWSPEQDAYFQQLVRMSSMRRPGPSRRLNHHKLAAALNERFGTDAFTPAITARHAENTDRQVQAARRARKRVQCNGNGLEGENHLASSTQSSLPTS